MAHAPRTLLAMLLLAAPAVALAADDNELMEEVDEDIFSSTEEAPLEDWDLGSAPDAGPDDDFDALGEDPVGDVGALDADDPAGDLSDIDVDADPPGDFVGLPADPVEDVAPEGGDDEDDFGIDLGEDPPDDLAAVGVGAGFEDPPEDFGSSAPARSGGVDASGKTPLKGGFAAAVVGSDVDSVTVELPVLLAKTAASWGDTDYWLVAEFAVNGKKVGEARHLVTEAGLSARAPTVAWMKAQLPVGAAKGAVVVSVSKQTVAGSQPLFKKTVAYAL